jgi:hypothetical protein
MKNLCVVAMLAAALAGGTSECALAQSASRTGVKNVVPVHGAFADGSGWEAVAKMIPREGWLHGIGGGAKAFDIDFNGSEWSLTAKENSHDTAN